MIKSIADGASYVMSPVSQGGGETNWKSYTASIDLKYKKYTPYVISNVAYIPGLITDNYTALDKSLFIDSAGSEFFQTSTLTFSAAIGNSIGSAGADPGTTTVSTCYGGYIDLSGKYWITGIDGGTMSITTLTLATAFTFPASASVTNTDISNALQFTTATRIPHAEYSTNGTALFSISQFPGSSTNACLSKATLSTPFDISTRSFSQKLTLTVGLAPNVYNKSDVGFSFSIDGKYLFLWSMGSETVATAGRKIDSLVLSMPWDLSTATFFSSYTSSSGVFFGATTSYLQRFVISPDGTRAVLYTYISSGSVAYAHLISLNTPFDISSIVNTSLHSLVVSGAQNNATVDLNGLYTFYYYAVSAAVLRTGNGSTPFWKSSPKIDLSGITTESGTFTEMYPAPSGNPTLYVDTDTAAGNLDHTTAPQITASNTPALFTRSGGYATKTITYTTTNCDASCIQAKIIANKGIVIEKLNIALNKGA